MPLFKNKSDSLKNSRRESFTPPDLERTLIESKKLQLQRRLTTYKNARYVKNKYRKNRIIALNAHPIRNNIIGLATLSLIVSSAIIVPNLFITEELSVASSEITANVSELPPQKFSVAENVSAPIIERDSFNIIAPPKVKLDFAGMKTAPTFNNNREASIQYPFGEGVPVTDTFGPRKVICISSGMCSKGFHSGVDFTPGEGTPIQVIADGIVTKVESSGGGYGYYVSIEHKIDGDTITSVYGHMITGSSPLVAGQEVTVGELVGKVGSTGMSTGAHLHFELHVNGTAIDPMLWDKWGTL
jgi:murein DD-endopeptidase MepM/ murein hydrolase activator NlpD